MVYKPTIYMKRTMEATDTLILSCVFILLNIHDSQNAMLMLRVIAQAESVETTGMKTSAVRPTCWATLGLWA